MILQALAEYFDRKAADPDSDIAPSGFEWKEIPYVIILKHEGNPINISSTYEIEGKKKKAKTFFWFLFR
ncbi:MAG: CRISPR-associated protein [Candidatus Hinthialibacteria bacterium OLB16]|nr:MAG: CRISPR-associated protein [Candidatus Hinthialibacteria bacterium OLB16]